MMSKLFEIFLDTSRSMALVLNPADMTFIKPSDSQFILDSTHLRILVISNHATFQAQVQIDNGKLIELSKTEANTPLYTGILNIFLPIFSE